MAYSGAVSQQCAWAYRVGQRQDISAKLHKMSQADVADDAEDFYALFTEIQQ